MIIDFPSPGHLPQLRSLWTGAFGDGDDFLDIFFQTAYSPDRCRCVLAEDSVAAVLYWFDCGSGSQKLAYIYAVVTHPDFRNRGLCRMLMENTHTLLKERGYDGALLVPQKESLRNMYASMGYRNAGGLHIFRCAAGNDPLPVRSVGPGEFARLRREFLPPDAVLQEGENMTFLSRQLQFFTGPGFLLAAYAEKETLHGVELLGDPAAAPAILRALGFPWGSFRTPGETVPFAMFCPLTDRAVAPAYFGFAFD